MPEAQFSPEELGAELFKKLVADAPPDSYRYDPLPLIDEALHTDELIAELQKPAMRIPIEER